MKHLLFILCLFILSCDSGDTGKYIYGCTSSAACNFDSDATLNDGSCEYPEDNYDCDGHSLNQCTIEPSGVWISEQFDLIFSDECVCGSNGQLCENANYTLCIVITITEGEENIIIDSCECNPSNCQGSYSYECIENDIIFNGYTFMVTEDIATSMSETKTIEQFLSTFNFSLSGNYGEDCMVTSSIVLTRE